MYLGPPDTGKPGVVDWRLPQSNRISEDEIFKLTYGWSPPEGIRIMAMIPAEDAYIVSQLTDLSAIPLRQLRARDDILVLRAMRQVVEQVARVRVNEEGQGTKRID